MALHNRVWDATLGNPLIRHHLRTSSAYSWRNLLLSLCVLGLLAAGLVRAGGYLGASEQMAALPGGTTEDEVHLARRDLFGGPEYSIRRDGLAGIDGNPEAAALAVQQLCLLTMLTLAELTILLGILKSRSVRGRFVSDDIRMLPLTPAQIICGIHDRRLIPHLIAWSLACLILLLPARTAASTWGAYPSWHPLLQFDGRLWGVTVWIGLLLLAIHRGCLYATILGRRMIRSLLMLQWIVAIGLTIGTLLHFGKATLTPFLVINLVLFISSLRIPPGIFEE